MAVERKHAPGKRGGAASIEEEQVAPITEETERENKGVEELVLEVVNIDIVYKCACMDAAILTDYFCKY